MGRPKKKIEEYDNLIGSVFSDLEIIRIEGFTGGVKKKLLKVVCRCTVCGAEGSVFYSSIRKNLTKSCKKFTNRVVRKGDLIEIYFHSGAVGFIDSDDYHLISDRPVTHDVQSNYIAFQESGKKKYLHRVILEKYIDKVRITDHINRNRLDNRKSNLRSVSSSLNNQNIKRPESEYKGVYIRADGEKWCSRISKDGITYNLGSFESNVLAACEYDRKALELYGDSALTNKELGLL